MSKTIEYFYEISKIPRESGNEAKIAEYLCDFAKKRNLFYEKDNYNNVIIKKKNAEKPAIILQAHTDMVCEKEIDKNFDFDKDSIEIYEENGFIKAKGTTLGADNGIGVAQILNILDSDIKCNIEAVFTATEETTMVGAENINIDNLEAKQMINLDGFEENTIITESASFFDIILELKNKFEKIKKDKKIRIALAGMEGGHSGFDIDKNRGNASIELVKLLTQIQNIELISFAGGTKFNVIPSNAEAEFISTLEKDEIEKIVKEFINSRKEEYENLDINVEEITVQADEKVISLEESKLFLNAVKNFKHGVFRKNSRGEITTSINLGVVDLKNQVFKIGMRSSKKEEEKKCLEYIEKYSLENAFKFIILGSQPGFETNENSKFIDKIKKSFPETNEGEKLNVKAVHITVEAGFFKEKKEDLEVAIISPKILGAHTTKECVSIESVQKCDSWLKNFLEN